MNNIYDNLPSPCWLLEEEKLLKNLNVISEIKKESGAKVLLALKGYALWKSFPLIKPYLDGCCASGLHEAKLADETFSKEVHTYSPAFKEEEIDEIARISHHLVFNSPAQFRRFASQAKKINPKLSLGLRVNPEYSESPKEIYNPCGLYSRLGTTVQNMDDAILDDCDGLHFHALCEQGSDALENVLKNFEEKFADYIPKMKWINFGGGHHITREGYDTQKLIGLIREFTKRYDVEVYLEPGEAIGWQTGPLITTVLDIVHNGMDIAILDSSAEAHMPDTIIMPYRADVRHSGEAGEKAHTYRLAGNTCLAGDIMGDYSFDAPLQIGDKIIFEDQMHYTMVKATTFNGVKLPSIAIQRVDGTVDVVRNFGYEDFKQRLS
ncbi:carboxynorspermidine decarboxylase [Sulfurovum sp. XTW-4]|uniref:Carboxynorspermidine/carboxyspermidine decarboxylase n=1 Tax=Sulfurovum xiamenensis TaxID=3019066 RepID=A0ABT7QNH1_9BACT|nr:carboxynorspermidine decarboxylase [Sulfurovum xiamenensis]MDM5262602.1 carboxynorspermidine decarboxylase [Sulfurovum xiamenensis]